MKGIVFTELKEMVEQKFGLDLLDKVVAKADLPNKGAYISGGSYPFEELVRIVVAISQETKLDVPTLLKAFGIHLFHRLISIYPQLAEGKKTPLEFIASVDNYIHVEVRKLYPDAELPRFQVESQTEDKLVMIYTSKKKMEAFGEGLMTGCAEHFKQPIRVTYVNIVDTPEEYSSRFTIELVKGEEAQKSLGANNAAAQTTASESKGLWGMIKKWLGL